MTLFSLCLILCGNAKKVWVTGSSFADCIWKYECFVASTCYKQIQTSDYNFIQCKTLGSQHQDLKSELVTCESSHGTYGSSD